MLFTSTTIPNLISFALSLNLPLHLHFSSDALSYIRDCVYSISLTLRPKNLCLTLSEHSGQHYSIPKHSFWFCVVFRTSLTHLPCCRHIIMNGSQWWWLEDNTFLLLRTNTNVWLGHGQATTAFTEVHIYTINSCMVQLQEGSLIYSCDVFQMQAFNSWLQYYFWQWL